MSAILFVRAERGAVNLFQLHLFALNYTFLHSITYFRTQLHFFALIWELIDMFLTNQNAEIVACILFALGRLEIVLWARADWALIPRAVVLKPTNPSQKK